MAKSAKPATKSDILSNIAEATQLSRKQVTSVFDALSAHIKAAVGKKGRGVFAFPCAVDRGGSCAFALHEAKDKLLDGLGVFLPLTAGLGCGSLFVSDLGALLRDLPDLFTAALPVLRL